jgi:hypothetical protein
MDEPTECTIFWKIHKSWLERLTPLGLRMSQASFRESCTKCGKLISGISENTLRINMAEHLKWHELHPDP